jgi:GT2 family glycosyltransferase
MVVLLMCNAPAITSGTISAGIRNLRENPECDSCVTVSKYNMWSPLRARRVDKDGLLKPFVPFEALGDPKTLNCDRDSQGEVWFADMGSSIVRPSCLEHLEEGLLPQKWMGKRIYPLKQEGGCDVDFEWQMPMVEDWLKKNFYNGETEKAKKLVSIVIPAMNEEENILYVLDDLLAITERSKRYSFEIIVVNDHSKDKTASVALSKNVKVLNNTEVPGKGHALVAGFREAKGEYIVMMDADYSHRAEDIFELIGPLENGAGLVVGSRVYGGSDEYTRPRAFGNIVLTLAFGIFHKRYLSDALNGFKAFRREVFDNFTYTSRYFEIEIELLVNALRSGFKIAEVPSHERIRRAGKSKSKIVQHGFGFLSRIVQEWGRDRLPGRMSLVKAKGKK